MPVPASIFSREAVLKSSFDKYAETNKGKTIEKAQTNLREAVDLFLEI